jgi:hypothetical protein
MRLTLGKGLRLEGKELAWELQKQRSKNGIKSWQAIKYYRRLGHALSEVAEREIRLMPGEGLADAVRALDTVRQKLQTLVDTAFERPSETAIKNKIHSSDPQLGKSLGSGEGL